MPLLEYLNQILYMIPNANEYLLFSLFSPPFASLNPAGVLTISNPSPDLSLLIRRDGDPFASLQSVTCLLTISQASLTRSSLFVGTATLGAHRLAPAPFPHSVRSSLLIRRDRRPSCFLILQSLFYLITSYAPPPKSYKKFKITESTSGYLRISANTHKGENCCLDCTVKPLLKKSITGLRMVNLEVINSLPRVVR